MGMRQRYLLGRYENQKYGEHFVNDGLTPKDGSSVIELRELADSYVESTDYYRTIQSGYSQLLGLSHNYTQRNITKNQ